MYTIREATSPAAKKVDNVAFTPDALAGGQWAATLGEGEGEGPVGGFRKVIRMQSSARGAAWSYLATNVMGRVEGVMTTPI